MGSRNALFLAFSNVCGAVAAQIAVRHSGRVTVGIGRGLAHAVIAAARAHTAHVPHASGVAFTFALRAQRKRSGQQHYSNLLHGL